MEKQTFLLQLVLIFTLKTTSVVNGDVIPVKQYRDDYKCGPGYPINGQPSICQSNGEFPCCAPTGWCGKTSAHCSCPECIDYSKTPDVKQFRHDYKCGAGYPINGQPAICNPNGEFPCCAPTGWCGKTWAHCSCKGCVDYSKIEGNGDSAEHKQFRDDLKCGPNYPVNGKPAICDPEGKYPCCAPSGWCGNQWGHCKCKDCIDYSKIKRTLEEIFEEM